MMALAIELILQCSKHRRILPLKNFVHGLPLEGILARVLVLGLVEFQSGTDPMIKSNLFIVEIVFPSAHPDCGLLG